MIGAYFATCKYIYIYIYIYIHKVLDQLYLWYLRLVLYLIICLNSDKKDYRNTNF